MPGRNLVTALGYQVTTAASNAHQAADFKGDGSSLTAIRESISAVLVLLTAEKRQPVWHLSI